MDRKILGIFLAMLLVCGGITFAAVTAPTTGNHTNHSMECNNYYWFDSTSTECGYKQFCGSFMYEDLQTFTTKTECEKALPEIIPTPIPTTTPECSYYYWFDNKTTECGYKQFCGSFMYLGLQTFKTREECETAQTPTACTMEAKICPDGTTVGRNPTLNCEFEPCPEEDNTEPEKECNGYYWFDEQSLSCGYKQFCGAFMWQGLQTFSSYEECEKALSPITEKCCPPKCMAIGSKSEGWYDSCTGERITWANCSECKATCGNKGTKSEGWYANCNNPANNLTAANFGSLIKWDCGGCADNYIMPSEGTGSETNSGGGSQRVTSTSTTSQIIQPNIVISSTGGTGGGATYSVGVCTGNQPEKCTQEYAPVCATIVRFNPTGEYNKYRKTFSNACMACGSSTKTDTVTEYVSGECEQDTDIECPMISTPAPGYCSNGETVPVYKEYNGVKCLVGFECRENPGEPADNLPVFIYTESNDSARAEKVFKLYKSGSMVETITNNAFYSGSEAEEMKKLTGKISVEETQEFLAKLGGLGFFEIDYLKDCTTQQNVDVDPTSSTTIISCPMGAANHKLYARYNNKENKLGWYNGLHETPEAIEYALGRLKYFEELLEGTPDQSEKYVKLGEAFDLYIGENAKVRETGFKVKLESIEAGIRWRRGCSTRGRRC